MKARRWTRGEKIAMWSLIVAVLSCIAAFLALPGFRELVGLDSSSGMASQQITQPVQIVINGSNSSITVAAKSGANVNYRHVFGSLSKSEIGVPEGAKIQVIFMGGNNTVRVSKKLTVIQTIDQGGNNSVVTFDHGLSLFSLFQ